jgi:hypothetical protein
LAKRISESNGNIELLPDLMGRQYGSDTKKVLAKATKKSKNALANQPKPSTAPVGNQGNKFGRKSIRAIMNDLQKRILVLQTNPSQWDALQQKVNKQNRPESALTRNTLIKNKTAVKEYSPETKQKNILLAVSLFN